MKKLMLNTILIVVSVSTVKAQTVSQETIDRAIDKLNCLATDYSLQQSKTEWECDCGTNPNYDEIISSIPNDLSVNIALSEEINRIKNQNVPKASTKELIKFLSVDVFNNENQFAKLYKFSKSRAKNETFGDWQENLKSEISEIILNASSGSKGIGNVHDNPSSNDKASDFNDADPHNGNSNNKHGHISPKVYKLGVFTFGMDVVAIVAVVFVILLAIVFMISFIILCNKLKEIESKFKTVPSNEQIDEKISEYFKDFQSRSSAPISRADMNTAGLFEDIPKINDVVKKLQGQIMDLEQTVKAEKLKLENVTIKCEDLNAESRKNIVENIISNEVIFLSNPNNDGSFNDSYSSHSYREGASIYKLIKLSNNEASFQIDDRDSSIKMAMQFPSKNIQPVCDSENEYEPKFTRVRTIEPGKVSLEGGKWNVKRKAKIRYES
jgi:hypothetical protein